MATVDIFGTLKIIRFADITFGNRGRQHYEGIELLADSIRSKGLICPIAVYSPNGEAPFQLVAGGRRYKALQYLGATEVSARVFDSPLDPLELKILELWENTKRSDLTDAESVAMTKAINDAFIALKGEKIQRSPSAGGHSMRDTARMLNRSIGSVSEDIKLATTIEEFPELGLQNMPTKSAAMHAMKRMGNIVQAKIHHASQTNHPLADCYKVGDFFANDLVPSTYGLIEVDPPYGIDLVNMKVTMDSQLLSSQYHEITKSEYPQFIRTTCELCYKLASPSAWIIVWCGPQYYTLVYQELERVGFKCATIPAIWKKGNNPGQTLAPSYTLGNSWEQFLYARKGDATICNLGRSNIFDYPVVPPQKKIHPTERPLELLQDIIRTFAWPGTPCLVPFAGSGKTLVAAYQMGHSVVGYDLSQEFRDSFVRSLK